MSGKISPHFHIGTSGWTYEHWKGCFYPDGLAKSRWFGYYASVFSSVEVNATFYRSFQDSTYLNWKKRASQGFRYVLKAPRFITHRKYLMDVGDELCTFFHSCELLEDHFGMILLQLHPNMPYAPGRLRSALLACPDSGRVAVEFRSEKWMTSEVEDLLRACGSTCVNVDSPVQRLTDILTNRRAYIRLHGRQKWYIHDYTEAELNEIAATAHRLVAGGAEHVYIYFNNDFEGYAPANALRLQEMLSAAENI